MKQCLDIEQMQHLQELGMDTSNASAEYYRMSKKMDWFLVFGCRSKEELLDTEENIPAYTLQDVLDALPAIIKYAGKMYSLTIDMLNRSIHYCRNTVVLDAVNYFYEIPLIDAAYKLLCWAIKQGYVETNKNE